MKLKIIEQASLSGGSFLFMLGLPLYLELDSLAFFYIYFAFAQSSHGFMSTYIFLPILSGIAIEKSKIIKRIFLMSLICGGLIWFFVGGAARPLDFKLSLFVAAALFCPAMTIIDIYRLVLVRSSHGLVVSLIINLIRWLSPVLLIILLDINPIVAIVSTIAPIAGLFLLSNLEVGSSFSGDKKPNSELLDFTFAFILALWGYATTWSISGGQIVLISQYYAARNMLNFSNAIIQYIEVHVYSASENGRKFVIRLLSNFILLGLTGLVFLVFGSIALLIYFKTVDLGVIDWNLLMIVLVMVYIQSINRLLMLVLRRVPKFKLPVSGVFILASLGCFCFAWAIGTSGLGAFYVPLIFIVMICFMLFVLLRKGEHENP